MVRQNPDYTLGKIYALYNADDCVCVYVGSTTQPLKRRYSGHKQKSPEREIRLIEKFPCTSRFELDTREEHYRQLLNPTLNIHTCCSGIDAAGLTSKEYKTLYYDIVENREHQRRNQNSKITCKCGLPSARTNIVRHKKSDKHRKHMILPHLLAGLGRSVFTRDQFKPFTVQI